ncbi:acid protease [Imleria badia]|nr:acid protease [Imleria badia]
MKPFAALSVVLLATSATSSVITSSLTKVHHAGTYRKGPAVADRARATHLKSRTVSGPTQVNVPATNIAVSYTTRVGIGHPPTYYNLIVDTGSSNTFCGLGTPFNQTSTSIPTGDFVYVPYGGPAWFFGREYLDQVTFAPSLVITNQSIGAALYFGEFGSVDGILGVGPTGLTNTTLTPPDYHENIPTVIDNLMSQGLIKNKVLGVYFAPSTNLNDTNGVLTYGGVDSTLYEGELTYVPVTETYPASRYWGINITLSTYGTHTVIPTSTAGIVDTGTTLVLLAADFFEVYLNAIPGAQLDPVTDLIEIPASSISSMQPLNFTIGDREFTLDVAAQLIPTEENTELGLDPSKQYGVVSSSNTTSGMGLDFVLGQKFMEKYYAVFDTDANRVGFAQT